MSNPITAPNTNPIANDDVAFTAALDAARSAMTTPGQEAPAPLASLGPQDVKPLPELDKVPAVKLPEPVAPLETAPEEVVPAKNVEPVSPRIRQLMEREAKLLAREQELKVQAAELETIKKSASVVTDAATRFKLDPVSYIRSIAPDASLADIAKSLWYEELGDAAPKEHHLTKDARAALKSVAELRMELESERKRFAEEQSQQQAEMAFNQYQGAIKAYAQSAPDKYQLVKSYAQASPDRVAAGMLKIAREHATATGGEVLTPEQTAERLEAELQKFEAARPQAPAAPQQNVRSGPGSLRNKHTAIQPTRTAPDQDDPEVLFNQALEAARKVRTQTR